jgi:hypothetical protein
MAYPQETKEQARELRKQGKSIIEIGKELGVAKSTVFTWTEDMPRLPYAGNLSNLQYGNLRMQEKYAKLRQKAYDSVDPQEVLSDTLMRDFAVMYLGEGHRRDRNRVMICNSNPLIMRMSLVAIRRLQPSKSGTYKLKTYPDHNDEEEKDFWGKQVGIDPSVIKIWRDPQKHKPSERRRCEHGILYAEWSDTYLRSRVQALLDYIQNEWEALEPS